MLLIKLLVGLGLLTLGRRLFWLFVGGLGFVAAMTLAGEFLEPQSDMVVLAIALVAGFVGALLAQLMQKLAIGLAGFLGGGYLGLSLLNLLGVELGPAAWQPFLVGGVLGAILAYPLFDWALILLSTVVGALLIAQSFQVTGLLALSIFAVAFVFGVAMQSGVYRRLWRRRAGR